MSGDISLFGVEVVVVSAFWFPKRTTTLTKWQWSSLLESEWFHLIYSMCHYYDPHVPFGRTEAKEPLQY